ncbi:MAG: GIY-YIG nuclease family protein [candidate division WOR-3 bacterium]
MNPVRNLTIWYVYVLESQKTKHWYIGSTKNLRKRILRHNDGKNKSTQCGAPWKLIYYGAGLNQKDARMR